MQRVKARLWTAAHPEDAYAIVKANWSKERLGDPSDDSHGRLYFDGLIDVTSPKDGVEDGCLVPGSLQNVSDYLFELGQPDVQVDVASAIEESVIDADWSKIDARTVANETPHFDLP